MVIRNMRLLIYTQALDKNDPILGFFVRWVGEFHKHFSAVEVVCLRLGVYELSVPVHMLGPGPRLYKAWRAVWLAWILRRRYDVVMVHMNEEYVLLNGLLWWILGKRVYLWRNHAVGSWRTRLAGWMATKVFYTSPGSYTAQLANAERMPVGIDTDFFTFSSTLNNARRGVLVLGRIDPVKHVLEMVSTAAAVGAPLMVVGSPTYPGTYAAHVEKAVMRAKAQRMDAVTNDVARDLFVAADVMLNFTPQGSMDKAVLEAAACGALPLVTNPSFANVLPPECCTTEAEALQALTHLLTLPEIEKDRLRTYCRERVEQDHSLRLLGRRLASAMHT